MSRKPTLTMVQSMAMVLVRVIDEIYENGSCEKLTNKEIEDIRQMSLKLASNLNWAVINDEARRKNDSE